MRQTTGLKTTAIILLIAFIQNLGVTLLVHSAFHEGKEINTTASHQVRSNCSCLEDAFMPMDHVVPVTISTPASLFLTSFNDNSEGLYTVQKHFHALRGPPAPFA